MALTKSNNAKNYLIIIILIKIFRQYKKKYKKKL